MLDLLDSDECRDMTGIPYLSGADVRTVWNAVKGIGIFLGPGSYERYHICLGALMLCGQLEGAVVDVLRHDSVWSKGQEWAVRYSACMALEAVLANGLDGDQLEVGHWMSEVRDDLGGISASCFDQSVFVPIEVGGNSAKVVEERVPTGGYNVTTVGAVQVYLGLFSGSQSDREGAEGRGMFYVGLDTDVDVYSYSRRCKVINRYCDIPNATVEEVLDIVQEAVSETFGEGSAFVIAHVGASPCCKTFSRSDRINYKRGMGYRDHSKRGRPPLKPRGRKTSAVYLVQSKKYQMAVDADKCVEDLIGKIDLLRSMYDGCTYHIENPADGLCYQKYMMVLGDPVVVDYCAYGHMYMKTTHFWTNLLWVPVGRTGNGCCNNGLCKMGPPKAKGKFCHQYSLCQASRREMGGRGRKTRRIMIPAMLFEEMLGVR